MGEVRGLVFGAFGEVSEGVHELVQNQVAAQSRLRAVGLQRGRVCDKGELRVLVGRIRKQLSVVAVKTQANSLITRPGWAIWKRGQGQLGRGGEMLSGGSGDGRSILRRGQIKN